MLVHPELGHTVAHTINDRPPFGRMMTALLL